MIVSSKWLNIVKLLLALAACLCAGFIGSMFTTSKIPTWYAALQKPGFTPPNWLFAPAWTVLYILMGVAAFLVWRKGLNNAGVRKALILFLVQLVLNALWSIVFFGMQSPFGGVIVIVILWVAILMTLLQFFRISKAAGGLMIPYILWVTYAASLNISIWVLNLK
jgi:benzodiazapine receptor